MNKLKNIFEKADNDIRLRNLSAFYNSIKDLYDNLTCNCFFNELNNEIFEEQLSIIEDFPNDYENYELNVVKGHIYILNNNYEDAFRYLSIAIDLNQKHDLPYALRASIGYEINSNYMIDLDTAIKINPSSRNNFLLALAISRNNLFIPDDASILYPDINFQPYSRHLDVRVLNLLDKAIELSPKFTHAYYQRGKTYKNLKDYEFAIKDFFHCIQVEKGGVLVYIQLVECLIEIKKFKEALFYALELLKLEPTFLSYHSTIGNIYKSLFEYSKAIYHYEIFIKKFPNNNEIKKSIEHCQIMIIYNEKGNTAIAALEQFDYDTYISIINEIIDTEIYYKNNESFIYYPDSILYNIYDVNKYLSTILLREGKNIQNYETNPIFIELNNLKVSSIEKLKENADLSKDEENISKLIKYEYSTFLGFGKYKNKKINEIVLINPHYILWCIINLKHFAVNEFILALPEFRNQPLLTLAIEFNLIKGFILEKWEVSHSSHFNYDILVDYNYEDSTDSIYYNDELDMDQQDPEFWDSI